MHKQMPKSTRNTTTIRNSATSILAMIDIIVTSFSEREQRGDSLTLAMQYSGSTAFVSRIAAHIIFLHRKLGGISYITKKVDASNEASTLSYDNLKTDNTTTAYLSNRINNYL